MNVLVANIFKMFRQEEPEVDFKKFINSFNSLGSKFNFSGGKLGFLLLTVGLISGAVWANEAWGSWWSWDPKESWALICWLIYNRF